jgi:hypothetical protein
VKIGDLVRFTKRHSSQAGFDYCKEWLGTILNMNDTSVEIQWFFQPYLSDSSNYDEQWLGELDYEPFEVISENR